jgi:hypothetical protein
MHRVLDCLSASHEARSESTVIPTPDRFPVANQVRGRIRSIRHHDSNSIARAVLQSGTDRSAITSEARISNQPDPAACARQFLDNIASPVGAAIVHDDDLKRDTAEFQHLNGFAQCRRNSAFFVQGRNYDG